MQLNLDNLKKITQIKSYQGGWDSLNKNDKLKIINKKYNGSKEEEQLHKK